MAAGKTSKMIVAGIDIGTAYSGWAYSMKHNPNHVFANMAWNSEHALCKGRYIAMAHVLDHMADIVLCV